MLIIPLIISISFFIAGCTTTLPPCDPNKVYIQVDPPVCERVQKPTALSCPEPVRLGLPYTTLDEANFRIAIPRCGELYPASPCLKVFNKVAPYTYRATCGSPDGRGKQAYLDWKDRAR